MSTDRAAKRLAELALPRRDGNRAPASCIALVSAVEPKTGRVKLEYKGQGSGIRGEPLGSDWAPVLLPMAGNGRAVCFLPKSGDQVLVCFVNGNWSQPVVIGFLSSQADPLPQDMQDGKSGIVLSPRGPSMVFDETKAKDKPTVVITDGEGNTFAIKTDVKTIEITAAADITFSAPNGKFSVTAQSIELTSTQATKQKAASLDVNVDGTVNVQGKTINLN